MAALVYQDGTKREVHKFDLREIPNDDLEALEEATGQQTAQIFEGIGSARVRAGFLWLQRRKGNPDLTYEHVRSTCSAASILLVPEEAEAEWLVELIDAASKAAGFTEEVLGRPAVVPPEPGKGETSPAGKPDGARTPGRKGATSSRGRSTRG